MFISSFSSTCHQDYLLSTRQCPSCKPTSNSIPWCSDSKCIKNHTVMVRQMPYKHSACFGQRSKCNSNAQGGNKWQQAQLFRPGMCLSSPSLRVSKSTRGCWGKGFSFEIRHLHLQLDVLLIILFCLQERSWFPHFPAAMKMVSEFLGTASLLNEYATNPTWQLSSSRAVSSRFQICCCNALVSECLASKMARSATEAAAKMFTFVSFMSLKMFEAARDTILFEHKMAEQPGFYWKLKWYWYRIIYICMGPQRAMIPTGDMVGLLDKPMANQGWCPRCRRLLSCQRKFHLMGHAAWAINAPAWPPWVVHDSTTTWKCLLSIPLWKTRLRWELWSRCGPLCEQTRHIQIGRDSKPQPYFTPRTCKSAKQKPEKNGRNRVRFCYQGTQDA